MAASLSSQRTPASNVKKVSSAISIGARCDDRLRKGEASVLDAVIPGWYPKLDSIVSVTD